MRNYHTGYRSQNFTYTEENLFSLAIAQLSSATKITMQLHGEQVNTANIPFLIPLLKRYLPNVLITECFNDEKLPFAEEVKNTEIGHLFEHILLEYLCQLKLAKGSKTATFAGRTKWNWVRDPRGMFHIRLNCGLRDADILPTALEKTVDLMKLILHYEQEQLFKSRRYFNTRNGLKNGRKKRKK